MKFPINALGAGFVAVLVGYSSSVAIIIQAAEVVGITGAQLASWLWALGIGMGITCIGLSLYYRQPILTAWSTPGAALLISALAGFTVSEAIGAFIVSAAFLTVISASGLISRFVAILPKEIAAAMLAGILLPFVLSAFSAIQWQLIVVLPMIATYLLLARLLPRYAVLFTLLLGILVMHLQQPLVFTSIELSLAKPQWFWPEFSLAAIISISLPLCLVTMTSQNLPGIAMIKQHGYGFKTNQVLSATSAINLLLAPFGAFALNLAAITAAICMDEHIDNDKNQRYWAAVCAGVFYLITGIFALTVVQFFALFPSPFIAVLAGLALINVVKSSLLTAMDEPAHRDAALLTFFITASGIQLVQISSAVWGLLAGVGYWYLTRTLSKS